MNTNLKIGQSGWKLNFTFVMLIYIVAHALMLLSNGVWWDDFIVWDVTPQMLYDYLGPAEANEPPQYAYIKLVTDLFPLYQQVYVFHLVAFIFHGISLICCWFILKTITSDKAFTTMSCALMAAYGLDRTSMLIICLHYTIANCLFLLGLLACVKEYYNGKKYLLYIAGLAWLSSLIVWRSAALLMPLFLIVFACAKNPKSVRKPKEWVNIIRYLFVHYWPVIIILSVFVPLYLIYLRPSGYYKGYYTPPTANIFTTPITATISAMLAVLLAIGHSLKSLCDNGKFLITIIILLFAGGIYAYSRMFMSKQAEESNRYNGLAGIAFLSLIASMVLQLFVYGFLDVLDVSEYMSRLLSLGAFPTAVIIVYFLQFVHIKVRYAVFALLLAGSVTYTTYTYVDYSYAWHKSELITDYLRQNPELEGKNILVLDHAYAANENESGLRFYAFEGMARMAYGADTKTKMESVYREYYGSSFTPDYKLQCTSYYPIKRNDKCELVFSKWLFKRKYQRLKREMLHIEHKKCD